MLVKVQSQCEGGYFVPPPRRGRRRFSYALGTGSVSTRAAWGGFTTCILYCCLKGSVALCQEATGRPRLSLSTASPQLSGRHEQIEGGRDGMRDKATANSSTYSFFTSSLLLFLLSTKHGGSIVSCRGYTLCLDRRLLLLLFYFCVADNLGELSFRVFEHVLLSHNDF